MNDPIRGTPDIDLNFPEPEEQKAGCFVLSLILITVFFLALGAWLIQTIGGMD
jgi:hypothetical protein